ncbi:MAG: 16S rRNA (guanine(966)-N(2))-methyltransferase RsmD [Oscillospiraceae bacterium]|nr:16S rRNA (guanine(966)-N(2))-methyltransferase RsmD [Oscillospiraceae bacterium]
MRVISGKFKGLKLFTLGGENTRPTSNRVKEGIFNALQASFDLNGKRVLDLFAGSGQMGIEALSRGASECVFVDSNPKAVQILRKNLAKPQLEDFADVITSDVFRYLKNTDKVFDLIFIDAPYRKKFIPRVLSALNTVKSPEDINAKIISPGAAVVCELEKGEEKLPEAVSLLSLYKTYKYGRIETAIYFNAVQ